MAQFPTLFLSLLSLVVGQEVLPEFSPVLSLYRQCPLDSPEVYFRNVYEPGLHTLLHEGRSFFASLLEALETSLEEDLQSQVEDYWIEASEHILNGQEDRAERIRALWSVVIGRWEGGKLPWEQRIKRPLVSELLSAIGSEHVHLQNLFQHGLKKILRPIQPQVGKLLARMQSEFAQIDDLNPTDRTAELEKRIREVEPTFVGNLLIAILRRDGSGESTELSFLEQLLEEVAIIIEAFRSKGIHHAHFWTSMSQLLEKTVPSEADVIRKYLGSHEEITKTLIQLLQGNGN